MSDPPRTGHAEAPPVPRAAEDRFGPDYGENIQRLQGMFGDCDDVLFSEIALGSGERATLVFVPGLSDIAALQEQVVGALQQVRLDREAAARPADWLKQSLPVASAGEVLGFDDLAHRILSGSPALLLEGQAAAFSLALPKWDKRSIEEPAAESVVRGPREGFTEDLASNTVMLRRKIRSPKLKMNFFTVGEYTRTELALVYIEGIAAPGLVREAAERIGRIKLDGILESAYIEELMEDQPSSPFPQLRSTERPDVCAGALLEGRIVLLMEGTPFALIAPVTLFSLLQSPEDYYQRSVSATLIRWIRYMFSFIALFAPSFYVAILTYHQEMVPTTLLLTIAKSREDIPFPAVVEAFLMEVMFEGLREAGIRLPKQVGAAVSIVGALVIGQAATASGLVSSPMVMVVAITGIASFMIPQYQTSIVYRILRFPLMLLSGIQGLVGLTLGVIIIVIHLCQLRSFREPYLSPLAPQHRKSWKDVLLRAPERKMETRPQLKQSRNPVRQSNPRGGRS
ncbi:spore germination protein KA [Paenibacillus mucilaginosus 3016]|uniref:Spore germination protein KA n=1 Tax=Paenibacillus mucilaginosus 3016 TaxID=1116391 RepID=H6NB23_9BACL|nr:spore germination protein [Paenibacillus mucilaginosus]AFC31278.1 spore germination protein KA [Paenibacillus mucilaginosus 3016]WFA19843.1 spore germination protein [Paenibacillus mucilaginosus]